MKEPKRYSCGNGEGMFDDKKGYWITYEEHQNIINELHQAITYAQSSTLLKDKHTPTFEEWIKTFKQVDGKLYQYDNYRTYCLAAMHQQYDNLFNISL